MSVNLATVEDVRAGCIITHICGELDIASAPYLREHLLAILDRQTPSRLILDLSELEFIDSSGVAVFVNTDRRARLVGCALALAAPRRPVSRVLQICGLDRHFLIFRSVSEAAGRAGTDNHNWDSHPEHDAEERGDQPASRINLVRELRCSAPIDWADRNTESVRRFVGHRRS